MGVLQTILISLSITISLPVVCSIIWFSKLRGEKKLPSEGAIKTRPPKTITGFFLGFALLVLLGGIAGIIYCCIADSENTTTLKIIITSVCVAVFSALGFFGYALVRFNYVVADTDGVLAYRLFRKKRYYRYEEISYFQDTISIGIMGGLIGYDKDNKKIFAIEAIHIGSSAVAQRLREHGVNEKVQGQFNLKL